jgi:hypothetical protein
VKISSKDLDTPIIINFDANNITMAIEFLNQDKLGAINASDWDVQFGASIYTHPIFVDVVAENWLVAKSESGGFLIVPYKKKMGVKWVYMPFFYQHSTWLGTWSEKEKSELYQLLQKKFTGGFLCVDKPFPEASGIVKKYQEIPQGESYSYNLLAKRMLKKAHQHDFSFITDCHLDDYLRLIHTEYGRKFSFWKGEMTQVFDRLIRQISKDSSFRFFGLVDKGELIAGLVALSSGDRSIYLKGAATEEARLHGAMYFLMDKAIQSAHQEGKHFDFGGSSVEGVARFNYNFGSKDAFYTVYQWDNFPWWFKWLKKLRQDNA